MYKEEIKILEPEENIVMSTVQAVLCIVSLSAALCAPTDRDVDKCCHICSLSPASVSE